MKKSDVEILKHDLTEFANELDDVYTNFDLMDMVMDIEDYIKGFSNRINDEKDYAKSENKFFEWRKEVLK